MNSHMATLNSSAMQVVLASNNKPILVIGDLMLDSYIEGNVSRISPEAPVPVLNNPTDERYAIGGAGNVALNLSVLKNPVRLVAGIGRDSDANTDNTGKILLELLKSSGLTTDYINILDRKTTLKKRILAGKQQLLRIDTEDASPLNHEEWIVNNEYCGKKLILNEGHCCSLHYHKIKDETFYIASGKVGFQMNDQLFILRPGDSLLITPGTKHRFYGLRQSEIIEFSTHHMEEDSYRDEESGTFDLSLFDKAPEFSALQIGHLNPISSMTKAVETQTL